MIDNKTIYATAPKAKKPSPVAQHVADHMQDPLGATKDGFQDMQQKKLEYDMSREKMQRNLAPVQSVIDMASQLHGLTIPPGGMMPGTPAMGQGQPGAQDNPEMDEDGNPLPPGQSGQGQPSGPGALIGKPMPGQGIPGNMSQTVGNMNSNRPSLAGFQPGVSPMDQQQVRPPKLGQAQPGNPIARNSPSPQGNMYNKQAASPKGSKKLPGAKGPGDPKVANRSKQAQSKSAREIKVHVSASASAIPYDTKYGSKNRLETQMGYGTLKCMSMMPHSSVTPGSSKSFAKNGAMSMLSGPASLSDKDTTDTQHDVAYNPKLSAGGKCKKCGKKMSACSCKIKSSGHSLGAKKGWSIRNKGHVSKSEKQGHYSTMV
jgi:hypothetical protein